MKTEDLIARLGAEDLRGKLPTNPKGVQFKKRDPKGIHGVVFHQELGWGTLEQVAKYHTGPNHMAANGLSNISYTIGVRRNGRIAVLNDLETKVWSQGDRSRAGDENAEFVSILFEGLFTWYDGGKLQDEYLGMSAGEPSQHQLQSALFVWEELAKFFNLGIKDLYGHYHFGKPACPGRSLQSVIEIVRGQYDFDNGQHRERFLEDFGHANTKAFQKAASIGADGIWGKQTSAHAYKWAQQHSINRG